MNVSEALRNFSEVERREWDSKNRLLKIFEFSPNPYCTVLSAVFNKNNMERSSLQFLVYNQRAGTNLALIY